MNKTFKVILKKYTYPKSLIYVNYDYLNRPLKLFDKIISNFYFNNYDSLFLSLTDYGNYWFKDYEGTYRQTNEDLKIRNEKEPLYKALYGLCCITSPRFILNNKLIGGNIGIIPTNDIMQSFRLKDLPNDKIKSFTKNLKK